MAGIDIPAPTLDNNGMMNTNNLRVQVGDLVRVLNRGYGLVPARPDDAPSRVVEVVNPYTASIRTASGRLASTTNYEIVSRAKVAQP